MKRNDLLKYGLTVLTASTAFVGGIGMAQEVLPHPQQPFKGKIGRIAAESTPDFPKPIEAPKGAPNVLLIMTDDTGFGASSTFGGPIPTPAAGLSGETVVY